LGNLHNIDVYRYSVFSGDMIPSGYTLMDSQRKDDLKLNK
jgi:hypothetical protein